MLIYLGRGTRRYAEHPVPVATRLPWEFQAVVKGSIAKLTPDGPDLLRSRHLWLSSPSHAHGWTGERGAGAEVVVFHFQYIPGALERLVGERGGLEMSLDAAQSQRLRLLARQALRYWRVPSAGMPLCHEHILMELSLMMVESQSAAAGGLSPDLTAQRVDQALRYFTSRMEENPSLHEVARAVAASPAHLRRLFHTVMQASPKKVFDQIRFQRAMQLMLEPGAKMESVGRDCGFGSASAFSRAFKNKTGLAPEVWRNSVIAGR